MTTQTEKQQFSFQAEISQLLEALPNVQQVRVARPGAGAVLVSEHLL